MILNNGNTNYYIHDLYMKLAEQQKQIQQLQQQLAQLTKEG